MLITQIAKIELTGGLIGIMVFIEMEQNIINLRPYWNYANFRDCQNRINRRHIGIMLFLEFA